MQRTVARDRELVAQVKTDPMTKAGYLLAHDMLRMLDDFEADGGAARWATQHQSEEEGREALRAYARWLLTVADEAQ